MAVNPDDDRRFDTWDFYSKWGFGTGGLDSWGEYLEHHGYPYWAMDPDSHPGYTVPTLADLSGAEVVAAEPDGRARVRLRRGTLTISCWSDRHRESFGRAVLTEVLLTQVAPAVRQPLEVTADALGDNPVRAARVADREPPNLTTTPDNRRLVIDRAWYQSADEPVPEFDPVFELTPRYVGVPAATVLAIAQQVAATAPLADQANEGL